jgi:quercetin dioxygenase-like cupin family protein
VEAIIKEIPRFSLKDDPGPRTAIPMPLFGTTHYFPGTGIRTANAIVAYEEFDAGQTVKFSPNRDITLLVQQGRAELTYTLAGTHHTEVKKMTVQAGDVYVLPSGAWLEWRVAPDGPYRHLAVMMPGGR